MSAKTQPSSRAQNFYLKNNSGIMPALWGLRYALKYENGPTHIANAESGNDAWLNLVGDYMIWPSDMLDEIVKICQDPDNAETEPKPRRHRRSQKNPRSNIEWRLVFPYFAESYRKNPNRINRCLQHSIDVLEAHWLNVRDHNEIWKNITLLGDLLQLSEQERVLLMFMISLKNNRSLDGFFDEIAFISFSQASEILGAMFDCMPSQVLEMIHHKGILMKTGIMTRCNHYPIWSDFIDLSENVKTALTYPNADLYELMQHFTDKSTPAQLTIDDIPHLQETLCILRQVISNALIQQEQGINILLYGAPGTGKTEFAKLLAQQVGAVLYEVGYKDNAGEAASDRERYVSLMMAQNFFVARTDTLLLFDEVQEILESSGSSDFLNFLGGISHRNRFNKAWVNQQLETNPVPVIWICNDSRLIDTAHLRRFLFHIEFRVPPRSVRQRIAEHYLKDFKLPETVIKNLSLNAALSPAQLENAARLLKLSGCHDSMASEKLLDTAIRHSMQAMRQPIGKRSSQPITPYCLDYLNVDSNIPTSDILAAMRQRPKASFCFYGPPGTGKTQLAAYMAEQLDQELIVKRASDLLSKWVGESEQNIAAMFEEAQAEQAILFLDEADSFLRDRQGMTRSWEVSQVNELLQQMERFDGIFICATNLFEHLDQAALRRFAFKIRFDYLKPNQRLALFAESLQWNVSELSDTHRRRLQQLDNLTPGDFATVMKQSQALGNALSAHDFLNHLENECALKDGGKTRRSIGFI